MHRKWLPWLLTLVFGLSLGVIGCGSSTPGTSNPGGTGGSTAATGGSASGGSTGGSSTGARGEWRDRGGRRRGQGLGAVAALRVAERRLAELPAVVVRVQAEGEPASQAAEAVDWRVGSVGAVAAVVRVALRPAEAAAPAAVRAGEVPAAQRRASEQRLWRQDGAKTLTTGGMSVMNGLPTSTRLRITSGGMSREYIIDIPADYDPTNPYRLIFSWHQAYGSDTGNANGQHPANDGPNFDAKNYAYFGLHREATAANDPAIFIAPEGIGNFPWDYNRDVVLFDDLLALVDANLCIDESRVFTTGFSFGAMMSYALTLGRPSKLRGAVTMAAANYNFTQPTNAHVPIAYMGTTGMSDGTCPWGNDTMGGKACVLQHAKDNGCTIPAGNNIPTATAGSKKYVCYDFEGCMAGYPVKVCTFDGAHTPSSVDDGTSTGDDGLKAFIPPLAWKFIAQF